MIVVGGNTILSKILYGGFMFHNNDNHVDFNQWVEFEDLDTKQKSFCQVSPELTDSMYELITYQTEISYPRICLSGIIWVHTPLGGAIIGRHINDEFSFCVNGKLKRCKVLKIIN